MIMPGQPCLELLQVIPPQTEGDENELTVNTTSETTTTESEDDNIPMNANDAQASESCYPAGITIDYSQMTECWSPRQAKQRYELAKKTGQPLPPHEVLGLVKLIMLYN